MLINWHLYYNEAKQRRKKLRLTQGELAMFVGVSTPTIVRFEQGNQNIKVDIVLKILDALGLVDKIRLPFINTITKEDIMERDIRLSPKFVDARDLLYSKFLAGYGEKMLSKDDFNDVCANIIRITIPFIQGEEISLAPLELRVIEVPQEKSKLNFIGRLKYLVKGE